MITFDRNILNLIQAWMLSSGLKIVVIIIVAAFVRKFAHVFLERLVHKVMLAGAHESKNSAKKRKSTIIEIINSTVSIMIILLAGLMIIGEFGVEIGPVLAAAGVAGLALAFGGQYLIRDIISGLFIILENQYSIGDVVCFDMTCGLVEDITLRMTTLRDQDGTVYHVPHGEIKKVANMTKDYARVNLNVRISYNSHMEHVIEVVNKVGKELAEDPHWKDFIIKPPQFLRIDDFAESAIVIKILGDTQPIMQWDVTGELRKRLKIAFDKEHIEIPLPQRVVQQVKS